MDNLQLDCALSYLNEGKVISEIDFLSESAQNEINMFDRFLESFNIDVVSEEADQAKKSIFETIKTKIKEFCEKAMNFIENVIFNLKRLVKSIKAYGGKNAFKSIALVAYASAKKVPTEVLDNLDESIDKYVDDDKEIPFIDNTKKLRDDCVILANASNKFEKFRRGLNLYTGDFLAKDLIEGSWTDTRYNNMDNCLSTMEESFSHISDDDFKVSKKKKKEIDSSDIKDCTDIYYTMSDLLQNSITASVEFKDLIKHLQKVSNKHPKDSEEDNIGTNARMMLGYYTKGLNMYSKMYSFLVKINRITYSSMLETGKAVVNGYLAQNKNEKKDSKEAK